MIFTLTIVLLTTSTTGGDTILGQNFRQLYNTPIDTTEGLKSVSEPAQQNSNNFDESLSFINTESAELNSLLNANENITGKMNSILSDSIHNNYTSQNEGQNKSLRNATHTKNTVTESKTMFVPLFTQTSQKSVWQTPLQNDNVVKERTIPMMQLLSRPSPMKSIKRGFHEYVLIPRKHTRYVEMLRPRQRRRSGNGIKKRPIRFGQPTLLKNGNLNLTNDVISFLNSPPIMFFSPRASKFPDPEPNQLNLPVRWKKNSQLPVFEVARSVHKRRRYDVPQIECPPTADGTERFSCPSADSVGRYKCILDHSMCDGFIDCPEGEDEDRRSCMFYQTTKAHLDVLADALLRWARGRY